LDDLKKKENSKETFITTTFLNQLNIRIFLFELLTVQGKFGLKINDQKQENVKRGGSGGRKREKKVSRII
jgi:hypothetical protein